jgi:hypothetical protein
MGSRTPSTDEDSRSSYQKIRLEVLKEIKEAEERRNQAIRAAIDDIQDSLPEDYRQELSRVSKAFHEAEQAFLLAKRALDELQANISFEEENTYTYGLRELELTETVYRLHSLLQERRFARECVLDRGRSLKRQEAKRRAWVALHELRALQADPTATPPQLQEAEERYSIAEHIRSHWARAGFCYLHIKERL